MIEKIIRFLFGNDICSSFILYRYVYRHSKANIKGETPLYVFVSDTRFFSNGFADRLRGIISIYALAKCQKIPFRIVYEVPFRLITFFEPNKYDWSKTEGITYRVKATTPIVLFEDRKMYWRMFFLPKCRQWHFYTNADALDLINKKYKVDYKYSDLFQELFKPSTFFMGKIGGYFQYVQEGYVSVSFRFMQLMGDFKDCRGIVLSETEQQSLIHKCHKILQQIKERHSDVSRILVTSDSQKFLDSLKGYDCFFTLPGKIGHVGWSLDFDVALKTLEDFYMISQARKAYMAYTDNMYRSCFARDAAQTTDIPYEEILF